jgi:hypothetical protein
MNSTNTEELELTDQIIDPGVEGETEPEEPQGFIPTVDSDLSDFSDNTKYVDYSTRGPNDVVLSGPIVGGWGPGRFHRNRATAYKWCCDNYGVDRVKRGEKWEQAGRWSFLIKNLKTEGVRKNVRNPV